MKIRLEWQNIFSKYCDNVFVVEGKKDIASLNSLGFQKVYQIHQTGVSLSERIEEIVSHIARKDVVCILTDFDKKGKQLYLIIKKEMQALGVRLDSSFRNILRSHISHIEGLKSFVETHMLAD